MGGKMLAGAWMAGAIATATLTALATHSGPWTKLPHTLDTITELSAMLSALSTKAGSESRTVKEAPNPDFDGLTQIAGEIETHSNALRQVPTGSLREARRLEGRIRAGIATAENLSEQIERFKSEYAVTHNVLRFVPTLAEKARRMARTQGREALALQIEQASREAETLNQTHRQEDADTLNRTIATIESTAGNEAPELQRTLYEFAMQGRMLAGKLVTTERLFKQMTQGALGDRAAAMAEEASAMVAQRYARSVKHWATVAIGTSMSTALAWLGWRTLRNTKQTREQRQPAAVTRTDGSAQDTDESSALVGLMGSASGGKAPGARYGGTRPTNKLKAQASTLS